MTSRKTAAEHSGTLGELAVDFLGGSSEMAARLRAHDWTTSILGAPATWPRALQSAVRIMLSLGHPMAIWWGADEICLFNDAHFLAVGENSMLDAIGLPAREHWGASWELLKPQAEQVMAGGGASWVKDRPLPLMRCGEVQQTYWNYSFSPIEDPDAPNQVGGALLISIETTERVLIEQSLTGQIKRQQLHFLSAPGFIAILTGPTHRYDFVNPAYRRLMGERDFIGRTVLEVAPEVREQGYIDILDRVYRTSQRYLAPRKPILLQRHKNAALETRLINFVYEPIVEADGQVTGIFVEGFDVTDFENSERQQEGPPQKRRRQQLDRWTPLFEAPSEGRSQADD